MFIPSVSYIHYCIFMETDILIYYLRHYDITGVLIMPSEEEDDFEDIRFLTTIKKVKR